jgi:hypothetical protein
VQLSPEFVTPAGSATASSSTATIRYGGRAVRRDAVFVQANYAGSDYVNAMTQLPAFGEQETALS